MVANLLYFMKMLLEARKVQQAVSEMRMLTEDQEIPESQLEARKKHLELRVQQHCQKIVRSHILSLILGPYIKFKALDVMLYCLCLIISG